MKQIKHFSFIIFFFLLVLSFSNSLAEKPYFQDQLIVQLFHHEDANRFVNHLNNQFENFNWNLKRNLVESSNIWLIEFNDVKIDVEEALGILRSRQEVQLAQFNHNNLTLRAIPNDAFYGNQWSMPMISAPAAWDITTGGETSTGDRIVVAIIDDGFRLAHEDLNFIGGYNAYDNNFNIINRFHGTHVSGIVGAIGNNAIGVAGVNWDVDIMPIMGSSNNEATVVAAYGFALTQRQLYDQSGGLQGAFVVSTNSSFGVDFGNPANFPIWCSFYDTLGKYGILSAGATMNNNSNVDVTGDVPTACPSDWLVTVTNTTQNDAKNNGAAYGATTIDLGAPGTQIYSTANGNSSYQNATGTSMATPHVAGAIALMYAAACPGFIEDYKAFPDSFALIVKNLLLSSVDPIPALAGITVTGGRLNLHQAVLAISNYYNSQQCALDRPPVAAFTASPTQICNPEVIQFTDMSAFAPEGWFWDFGDGNTSTNQNPSHTYNQIGEYTVTLIVSNNFGYDTIVLVSYINNDLLQTPDVISNTTICAGINQNIQVQPKSGGSIYWFDNLQSNQSIHTGNAYTVNLSEGQYDYYIQEAEDTVLQYFGPVENTFAGGNYFTANDNWGMYFDVFDQVVLSSVKVFANSAGNRRIEILAGNTVIFSEIFSIPNGESRVTLNAELEPGTNYLIKITGGTVGLYRNDAGAVFPYQIPGLISITGNSTTSGTADDFYYYFYDWEVFQNTCSSPKKLVTINVEDCSADLIPDFSASSTVVCEGETVSFSDQSTGSPQSWNWHFPGGNPTSSTAQNPMITYNTTGTYPVSLQVSNANGDSIKTQSAFITVAESPNLVFSTTQPHICEGESTMITVTGAAQFQWLPQTGIDNPEGSTVTISPNQTTIYTVTGTSGNCTSTETITVQVSPALNVPPLIVSGNQLSVTVPGQGYTIQWLLDGEPLEGATNLVYRAEETGNYSALITPPNGCPVQTNEEFILVVSVTSISEDKSSLTVYPNPNSGQFSIVIDHLPAGVYPISILNPIGQEVYRTDASHVTGSLNHEVHLSPAPGTGFYLLKITGENQVFKPVRVIIH